MSLLAFLPVIDKLLDRVLPDKAKADEAKAALRKLQNDGELSFVDKQVAVIVAEAQGESPAQRNWRPHLMYLIMGLLVFNGALVPLVEAFTDVQIPVLDALNAIPSQLWSLLTIGLGGYVGGRSLEKIASTVSTAVATLKGKQQQ